jgi:hypothetical protein
MKNTSRWDRCIYQRGDDAEMFLSEHLSETQRKGLIIAGAGFDPRSVRASRTLSKVLGARLAGIFIRENRPNPPAELLARANQNQRLITDDVANHRIAEVAVFDSDLAVIGGREIVKMANSIDFTGVTDVFLDVSALSTGIIFPLTKFLYDKISKSRTASNLHILVCDSPVIDYGISSVPHHITSFAHGFKGDLGLHQANDAAKLWLPQLVFGQNETLGRIHAAVMPDYVCPIFPFPADNPRSVDELVEHYANELGTWDVDDRNVVYAAQDDPLDLYRTVLQIDQVRTRVFEKIGGSMTVISPLGSKLLAIGSMMAAIEKNFPVVYVESLSYKVGPSIRPEVADKSELVHIWLHGEAYNLTT